MPERDRYIPGVPCYVETQHPDLENAILVRARQLRIAQTGS